MERQNGVNETFGRTRGATGASHRCPTKGDPAVHAAWFNSPRLAASLLVLLLSCFVSGRVLAQQPNGGSAGGAVVPPLSASGSISTGLGTSSVLSPAAAGASPAPSTTPPTGQLVGCADYTDCKAGRVCRAGSCVDPKAPLAGCLGDADCKSGRVCVASACVAPENSPPVVPEPPAKLALGDVCSADAQCGGALVCTGKKCGPVVVKHEPGEGTRLSLFLLNGFGLAGGIQNPSPAEVLGLDLSFEFGAIRYHVNAGFEALNGYDGFRLEPATLGLPIRLAYFANHAGAVEIEPMLALLNVEGLESSNYSSLTLGLSQSVAGNIVWKRLIGTMALGIEERYWSLLADSSTSQASFAPGVNFLLRFGIGITL